MGNLIIDIIAVIPYTIIYPYLICLRFLKLVKFNIYLSYFEEFLSDLMLSCLKIETIKIIINMLRLLVQIIMVSHFFACLWVLLGYYDMDLENTDSWIQAAVENEI